MLLLGTLWWRSGAGTPAPAVPAQSPPRGRAAWLLDNEQQRRTRKDISHERERYGIQDELALEIISDVAARQAERLEQDAQKRFEELTRELELRRVEFDAKYLTAMNEMRAAFIDAEIARLLHKRLRDEADVLLLLLMATGAAI